MTVEDNGRFPPTSRILTGPKSTWPQQAQDIIDQGYPAVAPLLPDLVAWLQDINWPGASEIADFLLAVGEPVVPHVKQALQENDYLWQYFVLTFLVDRWPHPLVAELTPELMHLMWHTDAAEADIAALRQLAKHQLGERDMIQKAIARKQDSYRDLLTELDEIELLLNQAED